MAQALSQDVQRKKSGSLCLTKISNFITGSMDKGFYRLGKAVGRSPWISILISLLVAGVCLSGLLRFTQESREDKLWTPRDSVAQKHKDWVEETFPKERRVSIVLLVAGDVLTPATLKEALMIHRKVKKIGDGTEIAWEKICFRLGSACMAIGLLELWSFDEIVINQLSKDDILRKINQPVILSPITKRKFELSQYIGGIERDATARIVKAKAMLMFYGIKFNPVLNKAEGRLEDKLTEGWETDFKDLMTNLDLSSVEPFFYSQVQYEKDRGDSIQGDMQLLFIGYILIIAYVAVMLGKFTRLNIKAWLALLGVLCIGLAIGVSFGLSSAFGASYGPVHPLLPFLLLGIGVDDMFVIVQAWNNLPPDLIEQHGVPEAIGLTLKHAGVSITITSLTDLLAFMIGASSILPALRSFCIFAGIGILADFAIQTTLFTAFLALDARRRKKRRDGCCCCFRLSDGYSESDCGKRDLLQKLMDKYFGRALLTLPGKITVMIVTGVLVGFNLYGAIMLRQYFDQVWFLPPNSMGYKYTVTNSKFFPLNGAPLTIYTGNFDYFGNQEKLHLLHDVVVKDESVIASSLNSWYEEYINWTSKNQPGQYFNKSSTPWRINSRNKFHEWLLDFLKGPGISYRKDVWFTNVSGQLPKIKAARFNVRHKDMDSTQREVKAMDDLRGKIEKVFPDDLAFPYSPFYLGWETNKVILEELFRNMAFNLMVVFIVTLVVLANLRACLMVFTCVGFTLVSITGTMHFWGVTIETVSTILLLIAVGLSVDYASHVAHTFVIISGTRYDRARATLRDIGPAVWNGGFSTFLAIALLAFSESYPSKIFFKVFSCVVVYGLFYGLCYLPVMLSVIGPSPSESAQEHANRHGRLSAGHPAGPAGDNSCFQLPVADANCKKELASNGIQNGGYPIQPADHEGMETIDLSTSPCSGCPQVNEGFRSSVGADLDKA